MKASEFLSKQDQEAIKAAVEAAEKETSGEIRVHLETKCDDEILERAADLFEKLGMHKTELRNGVLIYLAIENKQFAIIGDAGINGKVPQGFWESTSNLMSGYFKKGEFGKGLAEGVKEAGHQLKTFFPCQKNDKNELSDDISYGS